MRATYEAPRAGFFDLQAGYQNRTFGSNGRRPMRPITPTSGGGDLHGIGVAALVETGRALRSALGELPQEFRPLRLDARHGDEPPQYRQRRCPAVADYDWRAGTTRSAAIMPSNHIYSTNLGEALPAARPLYARQGAVRATLWLRHAKQWRRFDLAVSAGISLTPYGTSALWSLGLSRPPRAAPRALVPVDAPADLHRPYCISRHRDQP